MKWSKLVPAFLAVFALLGGLAPARAEEPDTEEAIEEAIRKLDEHYKKLRKELEEKLARARGEEAPGEGQPFLGLSLSPLSQGVRVLLNLEEGEGVVVKKVVEGGPAEAAGLRPYDIVLRFHGSTVGSLEDVKAILAKLSPGQRVEVLLLRDGKKKEVELVVGREGGPAETPEPGTPGTAREEIQKFLDQTLQGRKSLIAKHLRDLLGRDTEARLRARRFFEKLGAQSREKRAQVLREVESVVDDMLEGMSDRDKRRLHRLFRQMMGGLRRAVEKTGERSQKKEDIEKYLESLLGGPEKGDAEKEPAKVDKDEIDKLIEDLLGDKGDKGDKGEKEPGKEKGDGFEIPKDMQEMLKAFLGEKGWKRLQEMLKDPAMREMVKNFLPKDFRFTPEGIRKLMERYGVTEEDLPDRLREFGLDEETIQRILEKLKTSEPQKDGKPWLGIRASGVDEEQRRRLGIEGGLVVTRVTPKGPADKAGLLENDILLSANGTDLGGPDDFKAVLENLGPGDALRLQVLRDGYKKMVTVTLAAREK